MDERLPKTILELLVECAVAAHRWQQGDGDPGYLLSHRDIAKNQDWIERVVEPALRARLIESIVYPRDGIRSLRILPPGEEAIAHLKSKETT